MKNDFSKNTKRLFSSASKTAVLHLAKRSSRGLRSLLIYERNERMAARFAELAFEKTTFAAVGAAHLDGKKGLLRLLKMGGFSVKHV